VSRTGGSVGNILRNTGWLLGGKGVSAALSLIYLAIVTRSLGLEGFGQFSLALGTAQAVELLVSFQSWQIVVRYGIPHSHAGRLKELAMLLRFSIWLDVGAALVSSAVIALVMPLLGSYFGWSGEFTAQATLCGIVFVLATHWTPIGVLRMRDRFATAALADSVTPVTRCLGALAIWVIEPSVIGYLAVWSAAELLTAIAYWFCALRLDGLSWRLDRPLRWREVRQANPGIGGYAVATNLNSSLDVGGKQVVVLLVGFLLSPAAVGGFRLAQQLAQALAKLSQAMGRAIFPELMRSRPDDSRTQHFEALLKGTARLTAIGGALVCAVLLLLGRPALGLIAGEEFLWAYPVLLLLGTSAAIDFAAVGFEPALVALGRPGLALKLRFVSTSLLFAGVATLTPRFGTVGAGAAVLAASILSILLLWFSLRRLLAREPISDGGPSAHG
jgi:O-antigen/teichoic acid export membrane protein